MFARLYNTLRIRCWNFFNKSKFKSLGSKSYIRKPLMIQGSKNISIGDEVYIGFSCWLATQQLNDRHAVVVLEIGSGSCIGNFNHIYATKAIKIGRNVLTADKVYIADNTHEYEDIYSPILHQPIKQIGEVEIGDGSWLGENVCIMGAKIGKNCIIGANSIVKNNIPDYCVVVGCPGKIVKRYDVKRKQWLKTDAHGNFIETF